MSYVTVEREFLSTFLLHHSILAFYSLIRSDWFVNDLDVITHTVVVVSVDSISRKETAGRLMLDESCYPVGRLSYITPSFVML